MRKRSRSSSRGRIAKKLAEESEKRKERLLRESKKVSNLKMDSSFSKHKEFLAENSEDSRSPFRESIEGSESSCKNCDHSSSDDQIVEGPALPPEDSCIDHDNDMEVVRHTEGPSTPPLSKSPLHTHYSSSSHYKAPRKLD